MDPIAIAIGAALFIAIGVVMAFMLLAFVDRRIARSRPQSRADDAADSAEDRAIARFLR